MTLSAGTRLGPYEILAPIGAGGMGEVYKAKDTRLDRTVAIKVLPAHMSQNAEVRQRFEREARTISSLSHPHICALYDVGYQDGTDYLVMEYLEGETLADRLAGKGALPAEQLLRHGIEIADALDKAHRQGIVHRDLKPGNVMLTKSGVKLLDFGLAKAFGRPLDAAGREQAAAGQHPMAGNALTSIPTVMGSPNLTQEGTILGTFQYMAPEQLEGREADGRTDIFAFGAVLYEMATGKKAFSGATQASLISAILRDDPPPISQVQPMTPPALDRVVKTCLAKDPEGRWQTPRDVMLQLQWIAKEEPQVELAARIVARRKIRNRLPWLVAGVTALVGSIFAAGYFQRAPTEPNAARFSVFPPQNTTFDLVGAVISPNGRRLAFVAADSTGTSRLWVRPLDGLSAHALAGSDGASYPFWSPDSRFLGFFATGKLKTIEASGGHPQTVCNVGDGRGGTWNREGVIIFQPNIRGPLYRVSAAGGIPTPATKLDQSRHEFSHRWPYFLPDGKRFLYLAFAGRGGNWVTASSLDSKETKRLLKSEYNAAYAPPGYLLFLREETLFAQAFDATDLRIKDKPFPVAGQVASQVTWRAGFSVSNNGVLTYETGGRGVTELAWFDRAGKRLGLVGSSESSYQPYLSLASNQQRIAVENRESLTGNFDIWLFDLSRAVRSRFTFDPSSERAPVWSPEGSRIAFASDRAGASDLYQKASSGAAPDELLFRSINNKYPTDWSSDGRFLAYQEFDERTQWDIWLLPLSGDRKPEPFLRTPSGEHHGQLSPDQRWMAYTSNEGGRSDVYVQSVPRSGGKWLISAGGGDQPRWRGNGRELFYLSADRKLMAIAVKTDATFEAAAPAVLFQTNVLGLGPVFSHYAVSADGQRFLINTPAGEASSSPINVVVNWTAGLKR